MRSVVYADSFADDVAEPYSDRVLSLLDRRLAAIESPPFIGNPNVRPSLTERFGPTFRAFPVPPFTIVYRYDDERDRLEFLALPSDRSVW